jgi:hypothetical protein
MSTYRALVSKWLEGTDLDPEVDDPSPRPIRRQDLGFARGPANQGLFDIALGVLEADDRQRP